MDRLVFRPIVEEEFPAAHWVGCMAFGEDVRPGEIAPSQRGFDFERSYCAFEDGRMVGTSTAFSMRLSVPGGHSIPAGGLTWAAVLPTHRRRGILTRMVSEQLEQKRSRGEIVSMLLASEGGIYERFGYGAATHIAGFSLRRGQARFQRPVSDRGRMVLLESSAAAVELPRLYEQFGRPEPGQATRPQGWWDEYLFDPEHHREGGGAMFHAKHVDEDGRDDGYVTYRMKEGWEYGTPVGELMVVEMMSADPRVYEAMWDYLLNTDLVAKIAFSRGRIDEPLRWMLTDQRAMKVDGMMDYLWLRILDVPGALASRTYGSKGDLALEVIEDFPAQKTSRYLLSVGEDGTAECHEEATASADIRVTISDLGAIFLGGVSVRSLAIAGRVRELREGALWRAGSMFKTETAPYCCTLF